MVVGDAMALRPGETCPCSHMTARLLVPRHLLIGDSPGPTLLAHLLLVALMGATDDCACGSRRLSVVRVLSVVDGAVDGWSRRAAVFAASGRASPRRGGVLDARRLLLRESRAWAEWTRRSREEEARRRTVEDGCGSLAR